MREEDAVTDAAEPTTSQEPIVVIDSVSKVFRNDEGEQKAALDNVSLTIKRGGIYGIIGLSGAGKSTLIRLINGTESATSGTVTVDGLEIGDLSGRALRELRTQIGMIFQQFNLMPSRNVFDNVLFPLKGMKATKEEKTQRVEHLLNLVGLSEKRDAYPSELSGGQQQRVAIARALAREPKILLCDEATSALDPTTTKSILHLLQEVNQTLGITIVIVTHQMSVVKEICGEVAVLDTGKLVEQGTVYQVFADPQAELTKSFINTTSNIGKLSELVDGPNPLVPLNGSQRLVSIKYVKKGIFEPLVSTISREFNIDVNILLSDVAVVDQNPIGGVIGVWSGTDDDIQRAIEYLKDRQIKVEVLK